MIKNVKRAKNKTENNGFLKVGQKAAFESLLLVRWLKKLVHLRYLTAYGNLNVCHTY